jgi:dihydroorotate dehydrogenase
MGSYCNIQNGTASFSSYKQGKDAMEKLDAGADLLQLYTGFVYEGPSLIKKINKAILLRK